MCERETHNVHVHVKDGYMYAMYMHMQLLVEIFLVDKIDCLLFTAFDECKKISNENVPNYSIYLQTQFTHAFILTCTCSSKVYNVCDQDTICFRIIA